MESSLDDAAVPDPEGIVKGSDADAPVPILIRLNDFGAAASLPSLIARVMDLPLGPLRGPILLSSWCGRLARTVVTRAATGGRSPLHARSIESPC